MNKQGPDKIDWTDYTWNPISGCLHGCEYCYMNRLKTRFKNIMEPAFHDKRLEQPMGVKSPSFIFTGSSGDMWGRWVDPVWVENVLGVCLIGAPQHTYQFLTKNPQKYGEFKQLKNCWYGTTVDGVANTSRNDLLLIQNTEPETFRFVSFEPLLFMPKFVEWDALNWIIIGANSNKGAKKPPTEYATTLIKEAHKRSIPVWVKNNYGYPETIKERPEKYIQGQ